MMTITVLHTPKQGFVNSIISFMEILPLGSDALRSEASGAMASW